MTSDGALKEWQVLVAGRASPVLSSLRRKDWSQDTHDEKTPTIWRARVPGSTTEHKGSEAGLSYVYLRKSKKVRVAVSM